MQASKKFYNKCSENSRAQIVFRTDIFRKLTFGAPVGSRKMQGNHINDAIPYIMQTTALCVVPRARCQDIEYCEEKLRFYHIPGNEFRNQVSFVP